jgi:hypothetical protein
MKALLIAAGAILVYKWFTGSRAAASTRPPAVGANADAAYSRYGNLSPSAINASAMTSASGIGTADYVTQKNNSPYVYKSSSGFGYANKPMVDDKNSAAGYDMLPYCDPFQDESGN